jgi:hypothetical protein
MKTTSDPANAESSARMPDYLPRLCLYFFPAALSAGGVVWHAPHALPVFCANAGVACVCPDTAIVIATPNNIAVAVVAAAVRIVPMVIAFRIDDLLGPNAD